jgi:hypothetical protein
MDAQFFFSVICEETNFSSALSAFVPQDVLKKLGSVAQIINYLLDNPSVDLNYARALLLGMKYTMTSGNLWFHEKDDQKIISIVRENHNLIPGHFILRTLLYSSQLSSKMKEELSAQVMMLNWKVF